jgi:hypothetical protein
MLTFAVCKERRGYTVSSSHSVDVWLQKQPSYGEVKKTKPALIAFEQWQRHQVRSKENHIWSRQHSSLSKKMIILSPLQAG